MGDIMGEGTADEKPVHNVCLDDFYLGKYEVTQVEWEAVTGYNPTIFETSQNHPIEHISWNETQEFIIITRRSNNSSTISSNVLHILITITCSILYFKYCRHI